MKHSIAILGSARDNGNTATALNRLVDGLPCTTVDLSRQNIAHFSYTQCYGNDDFLAIVERIIEAPVTVLATPVYWYSYSAQMKRFIDRFSDLLFSQQILGRKLRGSRFALLSTGNSPEPDSTLNQAFTNFCGYLGLDNIGIVYASGDGQFYRNQPVQHIRQSIRDGGTAQ